MTTERYVDAIRTVFPDWDGSGDLAATTFESVPGWDSMNSVNLQMELESAFGVNLSDRPAEKRDTLAAYFEYLKTQKT